MAANSSIEWTQATWNCLAGCEAVSPGCAHCYAATMTRRLEAMGQKDYAGLTTAKHFNGTVRCLPHKLDIPLKRRKPTAYFVNSMSDLFHKDVPDEFIDKVFAVMTICQQHTFQVLTKRAQRMAKYCERLDLSRLCSALYAVAGRTRFYDKETTPWKEELAEPFAKNGFVPNVWLGVSCEDQQRKNRIDILRTVPAAIRFLSLEPLLEDLGELDLDGISWVIVGGESGPGARPCNVEWIRSIVEQCKAAGAPCFVKQLGATIHDADEAQWPNPHRLLSQTTKLGWGDTGIRRVLIDKKGGDPSEWPEDLRVRQMPAPAHIEDVA